MIKIISICIPSHNTLSRGNEVLARTIGSISKAINFLYATRNDIKVIISWVDDASTDETLNEINKLRKQQDKIIKDNFFINSINVNRGQAYCRNLAASLYGSDFLCFFDSDDEMLEEHLFVCISMMEQQSQDGKNFAMGQTLIETSEEGIHPFWLKAIGNSVPLTKIIRRDVWEFAEGFDSSYLLRKYSGEDALFYQTVIKFFPYIEINKETVKYWNYPGSYFDKQLLKFQLPPGTYIESEDEPGLPPEVEVLRAKLQFQKIDYLENKVRIFELNKQFGHLVNNFLQ